MDEPAELTQPVPVTRPQLFTVKTLLLAALLLATLGWQLWRLHPTRPSNVAESAKWGQPFMRDGAWLDCSVDVERNSNHCRVYDSAGVLRLSGRFRLAKERRAAAKSELEFTAVEGTDRIRLQNGSILARIPEEPGMYQ